MLYLIYLIMKALGIEPGGLRPHPAGVWEAAGSPLDWAFLMVLATIAALMVVMVKQSREK